MINLKALILSLVFLIQVLVCLAQTDSDSKDKSDTHTYITARVNEGLVIPHHNSMTYLIEDFSKGFEITVGRRFYNQKHWSSLFNYPELGFGFHYGTLGNDDIFGKGIALFHYVNYTIYRSSKFSVQNKVAAGLGVITKPFDSETNIYNDVTGSYLNVFISLGINADYRISDHFSISLSTDVDHMSNGAYKRPNSGINVLNASLGAKYHFNTNETPVYTRLRPEKVNQHYLQVTGNVGPSQCAPFDSHHYWNGSLNVCYLYRFNTKKAIGIGFEQFYSEAAPYIWTDYDHRYIEQTFKTKDYLFNSVFAAYEVYLGKSTIFMNLGAYLSTGTKPLQPIYPRIGVRHQISKHLLASFGIKAAFVRSEFLEFGIGYKFNLTKRNLNQ